MRTGGAFGRALASSQLLRQAIVIDEYARDFPADLTRLVRAEDGRVRAEDWSRAAPEAQPFGSRGGRPQTSFGFAQAPFETHFGDRGGELQVARFALTDSLSDSTSYALTRGFGIGGYFGLMAGESEALGGLLRGGAFSSPFLALVEDGQGFVLGHEIGDGLELRVGLSVQDGADQPHGRSGERSGYVTELHRSWENGAKVSAQLGVLNEQDGVLGSTARGAFAMSGDVATRFVGLAGTMPLGERVDLYGHATLGWTDAGGLGSSLFGEAGNLTTSAFGAGLGVKEVIAARDRLDVTISQPVRVESGFMRLAAAIGAREDGSIVRGAERIGLAPEGRQLDLELAYRAELGHGQQLKLNYVAQLEPGHDASAGPEHFFGVRYGIQF